MNNVPVPISGAGVKDCATAPATVNNIDLAGINGEIDSLPPPSVNSDPPPLALILNLYFFQVLKN